MRVLPYDEIVQEEELEARSNTINISNEENLAKFRAIADPGGVCGCPAIREARSVIRKFQSPGFETTRRPARAKNNPLHGNRRPPRPAGARYCGRGFQNGFNTIGVVCNFARATARLLSRPHLPTSLIRFPSTGSSSSRTAKVNTRLKPDVTA